MNETEQEWSNVIYNDDGSLDVFLTSGGKPFVFHISDEERKRQLSEENLALAKRILASMR